MRVLKTNKAPIVLDKEFALKQKPYSDLELSIILKRAKMGVSDIDLFEVNEAFASVVMAWEKDLGVDHEKVNVNGGAVGLGHPLAATGTRLLLTLALELRRSGGGLGVATACIGGGQGIAVLIESI